MLLQSETTLQFREKMLEANAAPLTEKELNEVNTHRLTLRSGRGLAQWSLIFVACRLLKPIIVKGSFLSPMLGVGCAFELAAIMVYLSLAKKRGFGDASLDLP